MPTQQHGKEQEHPARRPAEDADIPFIRAALIGKQRRIAERRGGPVSAPLFFPRIQNKFDGAPHHALVFDAAEDDGLLVCPLFFGK